jgi:hypothetical protein
MPASTRRRRRDAGFNVRSLFAAGEQGGWWDPSDTSTLFQDSAGTTPVTTLGQPVGLVIDKRLGGLNALGTEVVTNGDFSNGTTNWSTVGSPNFTVTGGQASVTRTTFGDLAFQAIAGLTVGRMYRITATVVSVSAPNLARVGFNSSAVGGAGEVANGVSAGNYTAYVVATATTMNVVLTLTANGATAVFDNISVREVPGNHLVQGTDTARPRWDARSNLLVGTTTLSMQNVTTLATPYTLSFTGTGTVTLSGTSTAGPLVGTGVGQRVSLTFTPTAGTLTLTVSGTVTDAQLEFGPTVTQYQRVTTETDYADIGLPRYLSFDGLDDFLRTPTGADINFTSTDEMTVCAGLRKLSDVLQSLTSSGNPNTNTGAFEALASGWNIQPSRYGAGLRTNTLFRVDSNATFPIPRLDVVTYASKTGAAAKGDQLFIRVNGALASDPSDNTQTGGNFGTYPIFIGRRGGTSLPFNGRLNQLVIRNRLTAGSDLANLERFVGQRTGVTL